ncbi:bile acid:sodium symporter family protein [Pseudohalioglobus lutimaris]|uniref:bile acid:sodium symporter family protein n=1 Tax=Pseudohalioglobus lutimaris TaxID=1737061 RepID=UPI001FAFF814|nr:bile acid:sodium symporter [Pseudohalioglobus lutimaris]
MADFYVGHEYWFAASQLILAMLAWAPRATLTPKDFRDVVLEPLAISVGTAIQLLAVPLAAFIFLRLLGVHDGLAVGIALIAAIPGGTVSNIFTFFARGNAALSISITAVTTLACLVSTPLILSLMISQYLPADFTMPKAQIMQEIALTLLLPLAIGMLFLYLYPRSAPHPVQVEYSRVFAGHHCNCGWLRHGWALDYDRIWLQQSAAGSAVCRIPVCCWLPDSKAGAFIAARIQRN